MTRSPPPTLLSSPIPTSNSLSPGPLPFRKAPRDSVARIQAELDRSAIPRLMNESEIGALWTRALTLEEEGPCRWLLLVRLAETALVCAGNYADNCEFRAAGDFLVNPRQTVVHPGGGNPGVIKKRHGRLSDQLGFHGAERSESLKRFGKTARIEIREPPLLPEMSAVLKASGRVSPSYLRRLEAGQSRVAGALAFLSAWGIWDFGSLRRRLMESSPGDRELAESCLCRFDEKVFLRVGFDLRRSLERPEYRSPFLSWPRG